MPPLSVSAPTAATYYWRIDSYLDGAPTGTPVQSPVFNFIVTDSDSDGFPDAYELAHTSPPSATALNVGDDLEPDGRHYFDVHHTVHDTVDRVDPATLPPNVAAWAVTTWLAAQSPLDFFPRA